jgi:hypothetical protein
MRWIFPLLAAVGCLQAQQDLDTARVTLSYQELRSLIDAAQKKPAAPPEVAVPFAVLSAEYDLALTAQGVDGTANYVVQTFTEGSHLIPLVGENVRIASIDPVDSLLILRDGTYTLVLEGKTRLKVALKLSSRFRREETGRTLTLDLPPCPLSRLRVAGIPTGETVTANGNPSPNPDKDSASWQLGAAKSLQIAVEKTAAEKPALVELKGTRVEMPAIVRNAKSDMRVVRDGSYMNTTSWTVRHDGPLNWTLAMPEKCQLLACKVGGENVAPILQDDQTWVIPLPAPKGRDETSVELAYSGQQAGFEPVRGEFVGTLPGTSLLVEKLEWRLQMPRPYEIVAIQGNVDFVPGANSGELQLTRELGRADAANVHVFYQKPETTK